MKTLRTLMPRNLLVVLLTILAPTLVHSMELRPFTASYAITRGKTQIGTAEIQLQRLADGRWSYQQHTHIRNLLARLILPAEMTSRSLFQLDGGRIVAQQFAVNSSDSDEDQSLAFDWNRGRVSGLYDGKPVDLPLQPGVLDSLSVQAALMSELSAGRTPQRFVLADRGRIRDYIYTAEGSETLHTAVGDYRAMIFRSSRPGSDKSTLFWCAPELGFLPLKVERRHGKDVEFTLSASGMSRSETG